MLTDGIGLVACLSGSLSGEYLNVLNLCAFSVNGTNISIGPPTSVSGEFWFVNGYCGAMCSIDSSRMLLVTAASGISGQGRIITVNPGTLAVSVGVPSGQVGGAPYSLFQQSANRFVGTTRNPVIWDVSGNTVSGSYLFPADPWYPYGMSSNEGASGRIDDTHFWSMNVFGPDQWSIDVVSIAGSSGAVVQRLNRGGNSTFGILDATNAVYANWDGAKYNVSPLSARASDYAMSFGSVYSTHPGDVSVNFTPDKKAHLGRYGGSITASVVPQTYDAGDIVIGSPVTTYTWGDMRDKCGWGLAAFPNDTSRILQWMNDGSAVKLKILKANS